MQLGCAFYASHCNFLSVIDGSAKKQNITNKKKNTESQVQWFEMKAVGDNVVIIYDCYAFV